MRALDIIQSSYLPKTIASFGNFDFDFFLKKAGWWWRGWKESSLVLYPSSLLYVQSDKRSYKR